MASFSCHVVGVAKQVRLERIVRRYLQVLGRGDNEPLIWPATSKGHGSIICPDLGHVHDAAVDDGLGRIFTANRCNDAFDFGHA